MASDVYSKMFTDAVEIPMKYIVNDIQTECNVNFKGIERIIIPNSPYLETLQKNLEKIQYPVVSYTVDTIQIDEDLYSEHMKKKGQELKSNGAPAVTQDNVGIRLRKLPIIFSGTMNFYFLSYEQAYSFLLYSLWINREKEVNFPIMYSTLTTKETVYYTLNPVVNSPTPDKSEENNNSYYCSLEYSVRSSLTKTTAIQAILNVKQDWSVV